MDTLIMTTARKMLIGSFATGPAVAAMILFAGATTAQAVDQQMTDPARGNAASHRAVEQGYGLAVAPNRPSGAYARAPGHIRHRGIAVPSPTLDFRPQGRP
jgi:hypothetical protein